MSVFNQLKNIFHSSHNNSNKGPSSRHDDDVNKIEKYEKAARIVKEDSIAKSRMPTYQGLEQYTLVKKLGEGAFSNVYKAIDKKTDSHVAIKIVRKFDLTQVQKTIILKEVQINRTLSHPSIIKLLQFIETTEHYFLILELLDGGEIFHQIVQLTYFSEDLALHCIKQVAEGIRYLHEERGVVHRDIKPENILFESIPFMERKNSPLPTQPENEDEPKEDEGEFVPGLGGGGIGKVKIADFGLSKVVWDKQTMTPCGTVGYTAPEIVRDERYSKSVDMWALGCVLYTMLCGFPPFYDESISTLTRKVAKGEFTFLSPWWDHISLEAKNVISNLLEINPKKRYTIDQFLAHPWMIKQDAPVSAPKIPLSVAEEESISTPTDSIAVPSSSTPPVVAGTICITPSSPKTIPLSNNGSASRKRDIFLSGVTSMKEVFDVSYAVHRMGEERAQRKELKKQQQQNAPSNLRLEAFIAPLTTSEDEDDIMINDSFSDNSSSSISSNRDEESLCTALNENTKLNIKKSSSPVVTNNKHRRESLSNATNSLIKKLVGGLSTDSPPTVNQRVKKNFELNLGNSTLLERRKNAPAHQG